MENATNGLIMAGSVLIGIIVMSLFVYMFSSMGNITKEFEATISEQTVRKFNEPFEKYIGRTDITIHDILTVKNLVEKINNEDKVNDNDVIPESEKKIRIYATGINNIYDLKPSDIPGLDLDKDMQKRFYTCLLSNVEYSEETQKIVSIKFTETPKNNIK